jgi:hypothetical protein
MSAMDAPDWQEVTVTVQSTGAVPDSPDWQNTVVGPGGVPVGPSPGGGQNSPYYAAGFLGITCDPLAANSTPTHNAGTISLTPFVPAVSFTANFVSFAVSAAVCTPNQNFIGVYSMGQPNVSTHATLVQTTAPGACDTPFNSSNIQKVAFASPQVLSPNTIYALAVLNNGGTPKFDEGTAASLPAANPFGTTWPFLSVTTASFTSLPASIAYASVTQTATFWLFYLSQV